VVSRFSTGTIEILYVGEEKTGVTSLLLLPSGSPGQIPRHREQDRGTPAWTADSLVQLKCAGETYGGLFHQGRSMRNSASTLGLRLAGQTVENTAGGGTILTLFEHAQGYQCEHRLSWRQNEPFVESTTCFRNASSESVALEMLSSFSLGGLSPFAPDDAPGRLVLHRLRSAWCAEGRLESRPIEELQLEAFHYPNVPALERFGQVGSMPVRGWHPFVALEDRKAGVVWGAQLACPGSWQLEAYRRDDMLNLSGGLADREFGHWQKKIPPGGSFTGPTAVLAAVSGSVEDLCDAFLARQERRPVLEAERGLPIVCNEWCTHWGSPTHAKIEAMADALQGTGVRYLVIDAGWYSDHGGWEPDTEAFPQGLKAAADAIRARGLIPGLWFEFETCNPSQPTAQAHRSRVLHRDGQPLAVPSRWFWDFRDPWVAAHLEERVIGLLESCGIGYLKIDYNDSIGIGCDGGESLGEGLRRHLEGVQDFWRRIRERLPGLVIENCSSGGHRLEPSMMELADMASFSDAHEIVDIPIVAANLHRVILPRTSQIWAVLRKQDGRRRLVYSLAATFLGRMGLSGDLPDLDPKQWDTLREAIAFYQKAVPVIREGKSQRHGPAVLGYRNPEGWQAVLRGNPSALLAVCHVFGGSPPAELEFSLPSGGWNISGAFASGKPPFVRGGQLVCPSDGAWSASAVLLERA
jgi:alpha-galactosidase